MSDTGGATTPYKSKEAFLAHGIIEVQLTTALDCSICRDSLQVTLTIPSTLPVHHLPAISSVSRTRIISEISTGSNINSENATLTDITTTTTHLTDSTAPEPAVRILPCTHIFGRSCLTSWFSTSASNRCPECNLALFPNRRLKLFLRPPTREMRVALASYIEDICGDAETATEIRQRLMSDWTRMLIREVAVEIWRQQGFEVEYEYVSGGEWEDEGGDGDGDASEEVDDSSNIEETGWGRG